jgi:hypothetical protein
MQYFYKRKLRLNWKTLLQMEQPARLRWDANEDKLVYKCWLKKSFRKFSEAFAKKNVIINYAMVMLLSK